MFKASLEFFPGAKTKDMLAPYCRSCNSKKTAQWKRNNKDREKLNRRRSALKNAYGLTLEQYNELLVAQNGGCKICGRQDTGSDRCKYFHVDHCHKTSVVRGLLCNNCNRGIGYLQDDPSMLEKAADYIRSYYVGKN